MAIFEFDGEPRRRRAFGRIGAFARAHRIRMARPGSRTLVIVTLIWGGLIASGARVLLNYEDTAGVAGTPPSHWPSDSPIARPQGKFVLVMLSHPDCPCTKASLAELEIVMAQAQRQLTAVILFGKPGSAATEIESSELWHTAARIPGVQPLFDARGAGSRSFHGYVSGQTMLYDPSGRLVFSGGITSARGHQGDNNGANAVLLRVRGDTRAPASTPVFGCSLHDPDAQSAKEDPSWRN